MADIHLDPATGLPVLPDDGTGVARLLSMLPQTGPMALPDFKQYHAPIPESEWVDVDLFEVFKTPVRDQGSRGSCTGQSSTEVFLLTWMTQGEDYLPFSACYTYGKINGGRDQGASISATIDSFKENGVCLESTVPEGMVFERNFPARADAEAKNYRLIEAYRSNDPADIATALQMRYLVCDSVMVGRSFNNLDSEGVAGVDRGPGNHAVCKGGMKRGAKGWKYKNKNSWSARWGLDGYFFTHDGHIQSQGYYESVIFRAVSAGPNAPRPLS